MSWFSDIWKLKNSPTWQVVGPVLMKLVPIVRREWVEFAKEKVRQAQTQDGWTGQEKRAYVIERLMVIQADQIGDPQTDAGIDLVISAIVYQLKKGLIHARPVNPIPSPKEDPYYRPLDFDPTKITGLLKPLDKVFYDTTRNLWYVQKQGLGFVPVPKGFDFLLTVQ